MDNWIERILEHQALYAWLVLLLLLLGVALRPRRQDRARQAPRLGRAPVKTGASVTGVSPPRSPVKSAKMLDKK